MYLLVKATGKYWRMDYRYLNKRKTLALGVYPEISLAKARKRREEAREMLADGIDPAQSKRDMKQAQISAAGNTFEIVARQWLSKTAANRATTTQEKITNWLESNVFPAIGKQAISTIGPRDVLTAVRKMEARGAIDSAHRVKQICGQVFRFAVAEGTAERDVTTDLRGALAAIPKGPFAAITEPKQVAELLRAIYGYMGHPYTVAALKLSPHRFRSTWRTTRRRMVGVRPWDCRMAYSGIQNENGYRASSTSTCPSCRGTTRPLRHQRTRTLRLPQHPKWRALYERKYGQCGFAGPGLPQRSNDGSRLPSDGTHYSG